MALQPSSRTQSAPNPHDASYRESKRKYVAWQFCTQADMRSAQAFRPRPVSDAVRTIDATGVTYYRWRDEYRSLKSDRPTSAIETFCELFVSRCTPYQAQIMIETWRCHYNAIHPHSSLGYRTPTPAAFTLPATNPMAPIQTPNKLKPDHAVKPIVSGLKRAISTVY